MTRDAALDGLRGLAIGLVVAYHLDLAPGGWVGVNLFFALSGYLITSLLLGEQRKTGTISLRAFYRRRLVRLMPALLVALMGMWLLWSAAGYQGRAAVALLPALFYFANLTLAAHASWAVNGWAWSLSVEEQFYALWPPLLRRMQRRGTDLRHVVRVLIGLSAVLMLIRWVIAEHSFVAFALVRGDELMLGAVLAITAWKAPRGLLLLGVAGMVGMASYRSLFHPGYAITVAAVGSVLVVAGREHLRPILTVAPLRYLGRISYSLYLWNGIIGNAPIPHLAHRALTLTTIELLLAVTSTHLLEEPLRRRLSGHREVVKTDGAGVVPQPVLGVRGVASVGG